MKRKYFGTDGVRGRVGQAPMTPEFALKLGWAAGRVLAKTPGARVLVGKDTRRSGYMFESALEAGFAAAGIETYLTGPLPTPAIAYLTRALRVQAGVVISASHNPHFDNGVKFFSADGGKLSDDVENEIEVELERDLVCVPSEQLGRARRIEDAQGRYIEFCKGTFASRSLSGLKLVVDCANGAAYRVAPAVLRELGAELIVLGDQPNGLNINADCGSTHLQGLRAAVLLHSADAGIALDGDGDRCLMVAADGRVVDGDEILYVIARHRHARGTLVGAVVGTLMSNFGLEHALAELGIAFERVAVGDRHVLERLKANGGQLGGETSGHTICLDRAGTGDGIVTALQVLDAMRTAETPLSSLLVGMRKFPQVLLNVPVTGSAHAVLELAPVRAALAATERSLAGHGHVLLRASGTEPVIRVMVEAQDEMETRKAAEQLAEIVRGAAPARQLPPLDRLIVEKPMQRRPMVAGNWKMNGARAANAALVGALNKAAGEHAGVDILVCPPAVYLESVAFELAGSPILLGAQNLCEQTRPGAFAGEIQGAMLAEVGCRYVIVGHSERRALYAEDDARVAAKFAAALAAGLTPILCVGETLAEREQGATEKVLARQLKAVIDSCGIAAFKSAVLAYEPVWAIGTGRTATPEQAEFAHAFLRGEIAMRDAIIAGSLRILYGGSVKADNARELFSGSHVDGGLIGGASLKAAEFLAICAAASQASAQFQS